MEAVFTFLFGRVHGFVGTAHQRVKIVACVGVSYNSYACGDDSLRAIDGVRMRDGGNNFGGDGFGFGGNAQVGKKHDEFIAADASYGVMGAHAVVQLLGKLAHQLVAGLVAESVVHDLEFVDVDHKQTQASLKAHGSVERNLTAVVQKDAIRQAGEGIVF